jgi:[ribosomal protein S5]-alanine N-acetyltransferase
MSGDRHKLNQSISATVPDEWPGQDLRDALPLITAEMAQQRGDVRWVWLIIEQASGTVVGDIGFHGTIQDVTEGEIGYALLPDARGRGYATEAATALVKWTFAKTEIVRIIAVIERANKQSLRVAAKLGMREVATDDLTYRTFELIKPAGD